VRLHANRIAVAGYRQVLEDGPDVCKSESDSNRSDYGGMWADSEIYRPGMIGPTGKPVLARARMTNEQANALRAQARERLMAIPISRAATPASPGDDEEEMTEDQKRRFRGRRPSTGLGTGENG
jgi:hypothetical protein